MVILALFAVVALAQGWTGAAITHVLPYVQTDYAMSDAAVFDLMTVIRVVSLAAIAFSWWGDHRGRRRPLLVAFTLLPAATLASALTTGVGWLAATQAAGSPAPQLILPALNSAFDVATARAAAIYVHPPVALFVMLVGLALVAAFLVGNSMGARGTRDTLHMMAYAGVLAVVVYVIVDLEFPRLGVIRVDDTDRVLIELRQTMPPGPPAPR